MSQQEKRKNIFQSAINAMSDRDEKAALQEAMKEIDELEQRAVKAEQLATQNAQKLAAAEERANQAVQKGTSANMSVTQSTQKLTETERKVTQLTADLSKAQSENQATRIELVSAKNTVTALEQKLAAANAELQKYMSAKSIEDAAAAARAQVIAEHTIKADETLSHLALKYYSSAAEPYWRLIYEANKAVIGDNPGRVRPGMVLKIPVLPDELKKK